MHRGKSTVLDICIRKEEILEIKDLSFYLKKVGKKPNWMYDRERKSKSKSYYQWDRKQKLEETLIKPKFD